MFGNWGLRKLEHYERKESTDEMKHADTLIERILGEGPREVLECDLL